MKNNFQKEQNKLEILHGLELYGYLLTKESRKHKTAYSLEANLVSFEDNFKDFKNNEKELKKYQNKTIKQKTIIQLI